MKWSEPVDHVSMQRRDELARISPESIPVGRPPTPVTIPPRAPAARGATSHGASRARRTPQAAGCTYAKMSAADPMRRRGDGGMTAASAAT